LNCQISAGTTGGTEAWFIGGDACISSVEAIGTVLTADKKLGAGPVVGIVVFVFAAFTQDGKVVAAMNCVHGFKSILFTLAFSKSEFSTLFIFLQSMATPSI
jgi:hypothetical protein